MLLVGDSDSDSVLVYSADWNLKNIYILVSCLLEAVSLILRNVYCLAGTGIAIASQTIISRLLHADIREGEAGFEAEQDTLPFSLAERIRCVCHCEIVTSFECGLYLWNMLIQ